MIKLLRKIIYKVRIVCALERWNSYYFYPLPKYKFGLANGTLYIYIYNSLVKETLC